MVDYEINLNLCYDQSDSFVIMTYDYVPSMTLILSWNFADPLSDETHDARKHVRALGTVI